MIARGARNDGRAGSGPPTVLAATAVVCAVGAALLGVIVADDHAGTAPDHAVSRIADAVTAPSGDGTAVLRALVLPTEPVVTLTVIVAVAATSAARGHRAGAVFAVAAPGLALTLTTLLLKPAFGRYYDDHLAYPSGHTVALVSTLTVVAVLARGHRVRWALVGACGLTVAGAAIGMAGLGYHHATDVLGGSAVAVAVTTALATVPAVRCRPGRRATASKPRQAHPAEADSSGDGG